MSNPQTRIMVNGIMTADINVMDRGFQYGDGVFETMQIVNADIPLWQQHWRRLKKGCEALSIQPPGKSELEQDIKSLTGDIKKGILKLVVTRGIGGRGYAVSEQLVPEVVLIQADYPVYPENHWQQGVQVRICDTRLAQQPALAGIKHLNRLEQVLARNEWTDPATSEGLMLDNQDNVIEGTMSNMFMVKNGQVFTPDINSCGVAGVMRETVLHILDKKQIPCVVSLISKEMLKAADEVFLTNSIIGLWPVKKIDDTVYRVGDISLVIQQAIKNIINNA